MKAVEPTQEHLGALDGLRFIAAGLVVFAHLAATFFRLEPEASRVAGTLGSSGMTLFFVLSGFVIHYNYSASIKGGGLLDFFVARFARIYPLYLFALLADFAVNATMRPYDEATGLIPAAPLQLALLQTWIYWPMGERALHYAGNSVGPISWSISTEWFFYLCYPIILTGFARLSDRRRTAAAMLCLVAAVIAIWTLAPINRIEEAMVARYGAVASNEHFGFVRWMFYYTPYARISEFLLGALAAHLFMQGPRQDASIWAGPSALIALVFSIWLQMRLPPGPLAWSFGIAPFIALAIYLCARYPQNLTARALSCRPIAVLGGASYSVYLLHPIILTGFGMSEGELASASLAHSLARGGLSLVLILGLSLGSYRYFESPARRFIRGLQPKAERPVHAEAWSAR